MQRYVRQRELPETTKALQTAQRTGRAQGRLEQERQRRADEDDVDSQDFVSHRSPAWQRDEHERKLYLIVVVVIRGE